MFSTEAMGSHEWATWSMFSTEAIGPHEWAHNVVNYTAAVDAAVCRKIESF